ncbi:polysaccharide pyruvyl transferase CsaB [Caldalkalibacillus uzonensis]|uniref:Polysaccharide pyruvyl transferase CsaB n=1 Tax=Caldalkalibacillus uzonensis TaxID=353224 RepID=A0ABU0CQ15_9BACI|nr:polysaccharide pyruvyl transferase CsaB [Caldalkalibacillus uzonensis]MDQ0338498.1 polysaccharide pyruvyl transferase CsaB [Caldalkalibacillus uzonensis]
MDKQIMVAGYYGADNLGDEAILTGIIDSLSQNGFNNVTVLSKSPQKTEQMHNVKSIYIGRKFKGLNNIYRSLKSTDLFILGGGGLLQDYTKRVVPFWLSRVILALKAGTPIMYYAQGIGPLQTQFSRWLVKKISNKVNYITVRDSNSLHLLQTIGIDKTKIELTADPALGIEIHSDGNYLLRNEGIPINCHKNFVGVGLRPWYNDYKYLPVLQVALSYLQQKYDLNYIFFPFQKQVDEKICKRMIGRLDPNKSFIIKGHYTPEQIAAMISQTNGVIAMRLHALILSAISFTPCFGLVYDPKVYHFMSQLDLHKHTFDITADLTNEEKLTSSLETWWETKQYVKTQLEVNIPILQKRNMRNVEIVKELLSTF